MIQANPFIKFPGDPVTNTLHPCIWWVVCYWSRFTCVGCWNGHEMVKVTQPRQSSWHWQMTDTVSPSQWQVGITPVSHLVRHQPLPRILAITKTSTISILMTLVSPFWDTLVPYCGRCQVQDTWCNGTHPWHWHWGVKSNKTTGR